MISIMGLVMRPIQGNRLNDFSFDRNCKSPTNEFVGYVEQVEKVHKNLCLTVIVQTLELCKNPDPTNECLSLKKDSSYARKLC